MRLSGECMLLVSLLREIKETFGRFLALLLIIGLGVGFFAGLKVTDPAMRTSMHEYLKEQAFFDFQERMVRQPGKDFIWS